MLTVLTSRSSSVKCYWH